MEGNLRDLERVVNNHELVDDEVGFERAEVIETEAYVLARTTIIGLQEPSHNAYYNHKATGNWLIVDDFEAFLHKGKSNNDPMEIVIVDYDSGYFLPKEYTSMTSTQLEWEDTRRKLLFEEIAIFSDEVDFEKLNEFLEK